MGLWCGYGIIAIWKMGLMSPCMAALVMGLLMVMVVVVVKSIENRFIATVLETCNLHMRIVTTHLFIYLFILFLHSLISK